MPFALLVDGLFSGGLGANPVETITHETGTWALRLLLVTLAVTPLRRLTGWNLLVRYRRMLGLFAFFYACLHFTTYLWLDQYFDVAAIIDDIVERPYITLGFTGFVLLLPLAATSTNAMVRRLGGKRWRQLHRLGYVAACARGVALSVAGQGGLSRTAGLHGDPRSAVAAPVSLIAERLSGWRADTSVGVSARCRPRG